MHYQYKKRRLFLGFTMAILIVAGCAPKAGKEISLLPGKKSAAEAISIIRSRSTNAPPLKASSRCDINDYFEGKKNKQSLPLKLWVNPPFEIYIQGDIAFNPKGLVAGSNEREFWLAVSLKEVSSYWWGEWAGGTFPRELILSPKTLLEALGIAQIAGDQNWSLSNEGTFDILAKRNEHGVIVKKIYILNSSDYPIKRIEYFDDSGKATIVTKLDKYEQLTDDISVPTVMEITKAGEGDDEPASPRGEQDSVEIKLSSVKQTELTDKQRNRLFIRPQPQGFRHIYKIINGNIIEQPQ